MSACPSSEDGETGHPPKGCANPPWRPGSGDRIGLQGEGAGKKEAEQCREGGRLLPWKEVQGILGSEFSLQGTRGGGSGGGAGGWGR